MPANNLWSTSTASGTVPGRQLVNMPWGTDNGGPQRTGHLFTKTDPGDGGATALSINSLAQTARQSYHWGTWMIQVGAQTIAAQNWTIACAGKEGNAAANQFPVTGIYIFRSGTGKIATLYDVQAEQGTEWTASDSGQDIVLACSAATVLNNDWLVAEYWFAAVQSMATAYALNTQFGGNLATSQFKLTPTNTLYLSGESPPTASAFNALALAGD